MKTSFTAFLFLLFPFFSSAQIFVDGENLDTLLRGNFVEVCTWQLPFSLRVKATVNYGQPVKFALSYPEEGRLTNEKGEAIKFYSYIEMLNLFDYHGYDYFGPSDGGDDYRCYLFRKFE
jgi:hypothetical protein